MNKSELSHSVAEACDLSGAAGTAAVEAVFNAIKGALAGGEKVSIPGFGAFETRDRPERQGRNPRTGESMTIKAIRAAAFKPAQALKDAVAGR